MPPHFALMLALAGTTTTAGEISSVKWAIGGELFARARAEKTDGGDFEKSYAVTRARISLTLRYESLLRITIEPDFASALCAAGGALCDDAELSDAFLEVSPFDELEFRAGQAKTPFGVLDTSSAWRLPTHRRGLVSQLSTNRLGFGGRKLGIKARARLKALPLKPGLELGLYTDADRAYDEDFALRATVKPWKGGEAQLAGYLQKDATNAGGAAYAGAFALLHDRRELFAAAEIQAGRARLLTIAGDVGADATFFAARALAAYSLSLAPERRYELEPYLGLDLFDPNAATKDDFGGELRGGLNFYLLRMLRLSVEVDRRQGGPAFPEPKATVVSFFIGGSLE